MSICQAVKTTWQKAVLPLAMGSPRLLTNFSEKLYILRRSLLKACREKGLTSIRSTLLR
ncbi:hypothetical protein FKM82_021009 [Ascaphus truei]